MAQFFITAIEQMDLALDQMLIDDPNYHRFALMLVDNVVELCLHKNAESISFRERLIFPGKVRKYSEKLLKDALRTGFENKVELAKKSGVVTEEIGNSILTLHSIRNEAYHTGRSNDSIIGELALFYFGLACDLFINRPSVSSLNAILDRKLPMRVMKHIGAEPIEKILDLSPRVFARLKAAANNLRSGLIDNLLSDIENMIAEVDACANFLVDHRYGGSNREAVFAYAISEEERRDQTPTHKVETIDNVTIHSEVWPESKSPKQPKDPVLTYRRQFAQMQGESNEHKILAKYRNFLAQTAIVRSAIRGKAIELQLDLQSKDGDDP